MGAIISTLTLEEVRLPLPTRHLSLPLVTLLHPAPPPHHGYPSSPSHSRWVRQAASRTSPRYSNARVPGLAHGCQAIYPRPPQHVRPARPVHLERSLVEEDGHAAATTSSTQIRVGLRFCFPLFLPCPLKIPLLSIKHMCAAEMGSRG